MTSLSASFGVTRQDRLPASAQIKASARDFQIVDWFLSQKSPDVQRMVVLYDADRDERILDFLTAANYLCPQIRTNIIGVAESKACVAVFYGDALTVDAAQRMLSEAARKAVWPADRWTVEVIPVPISDGRLARDRLPEDSPLLTAPGRFQLGLVEVRS